MCDAGVVDCAISDIDGCSDFDEKILPMFPLLVSTGFVMCLMAVGIGANDASNSWGTSIGAGAISMKRGLLIGGIFEWLGATLLGTGVSDKLQQGVSRFNDPNCVACGYCNSQVYNMSAGMFGALTAAGLFMTLATIYSLPVSTSHVIVGGVVGAVWYLVGAECMNWELDALGGILVSWILSPVLAGMFSILIFETTNSFVINSNSPSKRALIAFPIVIFLSIFAIVALILIKKDFFNSITTWLISCSIGLFCGICAIVWGVPYILHEMEENKLKTIVVNYDDNDDNDTTTILSIIHNDTNENKSEPIIRDGPSHDQAITLEIFKFLLVFTAVLESFAHGSNDTANAAAAFSYTFNLYKNGRNSCNVVDYNRDIGESLILSLAGICVAIGCVQFGHRVVETIGGGRLAELSFHRAWCIEFSSAITVLFASLINVPVSTTHCQVGALIAIGLWIRCPVDWKLVAQISLLWVLTLPFAIFTSAGITALTIFMIS